MRWVRSCCRQHVNHGGALAAAAGLAVAGAIAFGIWLIGRRRRSANDFASAVLLAASVVVLALVVPFYFLAARTHPPHVVWNFYGFLDRRWLTSLFMITTAGAALALATAAQAVAVGRGRPPSWRAWIGGMLPARAGGEPTAVPPRRWGRTALTLAAAAAFAAYFFAPPWHVAHTPLGYHEALTMGGVQAVRTGSIPYIDSAAVQYGPLAQLANVAYVGITGRLSVDGFREVTLLFQWLAATLFVGALALRVRPLVAVVTALAAVLFFPTLQTFALTSQERVRRVLGLDRRPALRRAVRAGDGASRRSRRARRSRSVRLRAPALGVGWGVLCLLAQENLIGGALTLGILSVLLVVTDTIGYRAILRTLGGSPPGWCSWRSRCASTTPRTASSGASSSSTGSCRGAVARGYSNTVFPNLTYRRLFHGVPFLLGALLLAALLTGRPLRVARQWSDRRVVLVSALVAAVVSHLGALTRSDAPHLVNTELALPAAICLAAFDLPALLGAQRARSRWLGGIAIALVTVAILPFTVDVFDPGKTPDKLARPLHRADQPAGQHPGAAADPGALAGGRADRQRDRAPAHLLHEDPHPDEGPRALHGPPARRHRLAPRVRRRHRDRHAAGGLLPGRPAPRGVPAGLRHDGAQQRHPQGVAARLRRPREAHGRDRHDGPDTDGAADLGPSAPTPSDGRGAVGGLPCSGMASPACAGARRHAAMNTSTKASAWSAASSGVRPSGSPKTTKAPAIELTLVAAVISAITATGRADCSPR